MVEITVKKRVSDDALFPEKCLEAGDFEGNYACPFHRFRNRTHGRKSPVEYNKPKCTLFDVWLDAPYRKCPECVEAVKNAKGNKS